MPRPPRPLKLPPGAKITPEVAFAQVLRERRLALGLLQADLEGDGALDQSTISKLELGKMEVGLRGILYLAKRLEIDPGDLVREVARKLEGQTPTVRRRAKNAR